MGHELHDEHLGLVYLFVEESVDPIPAHRLPPVALTNVHIQVIITHKVRYNLQGTQ